MNVALFCEMLYTDTESNVLKLCSVKTLSKSYQPFKLGQARPDIFSTRASRCLRYSIKHGSCSQSLCNSVMINVVFQLQLT